MMVITEPSVWLLSRPAFYPHPRYELPPGGGPAARLIATAGKVCYDSYGAEGNPVDEHVKNLVKQTHYSVLEHANYGVFIDGISRGCSHELVRHRHFSYSQRSTRYTKEDDAAIVLEPYYANIHLRYLTHGAITREEHQLLIDCMDVYRMAFQRYREAVTSLITLAPPDASARKWARGKARQLLPHALETRLVMTGNLTAWRHFFLMRTGRGAEPEMRRLAHELYKLIEPECPPAFSDFTVGEYGGYLEVTRA